MSRKRDRNRIEDSDNHSVTALGLGIDTARYGHHATFLRDDKKQAAPCLQFLESRDGYRQLETQLRELHRKHPHVPIYARIDAAGQYATNLETFLHALADPPHGNGPPHDPLPLSISLGEPKRNKDYHRAVSPKRKADPSESFAMARYAVVERPPASPAKPPQFAALRRVAARLQAQVKQTTRVTNQLHEALSAAFPELATLVEDIATAWVLLLLLKHPSAAQVAAAALSSLKRIPRIPAGMADKLQAAARTSVASLSCPMGDELVRQLAEELRHCLDQEKRWKELLEQAYDVLPPGPHRAVVSVKGIGKQTAAAIVATAVDIERFETAEHFVGYYGVFPEEDSSGVDKFGQPIPAGKKRMCTKGNDLVRGLLWNCAKCASQPDKGNPAVRALFQRLTSGEKPKRKDVAFGYCMTKLLRQVFGVWTSGKPFDPQYQSRGKTETESVATLESPQRDAADSPIAGPETKTAAGRKEQSSHGKAVTAADPIVSAAAAESKSHGKAASAPSSASPSRSRWVDFDAVRAQVTMEQVLRHLGVFDRLRRSGNDRAQYRGPCPVHGQEHDRHRSFSVNLEQQCYQCFHAPCQSKGNVIHLWAAVHGQTLHEAALNLVETFDLDPQ